MPQVITPVILTPIDSKSRILVPTLHKNDHIVEAKSIEPAAFHFDDSGRSSVSKGIVWAAINTGRKKRIVAVRNSVNI